VAGRVGVLASSKRCGGTVIEFGLGDTDRVRGSLYEL